MQDESEQLPFRQVHLDFHTSELIPDIGRHFSKEQFQEMLQVGRVNSITVFSKCHHGWAYHPSKANETHPGLSFDLLGQMISAAHAIGVRTPVYISVGLDEKLARRHPEWLIRKMDEKTTWAPDFMHAGYHQLCFNTPYLEILLPQIEEVLRNYAADGLFLDIARVEQCYCQHCVRTARDRGADPRDQDAMQPIWEATYANYCERVRALVEALRPGLRAFHNGGHIQRGRRDLMHRNTHLEIESLPTGGWGYDHFPLSARYVQKLGSPFLGMTGKFHTHWGEFGGYKHPNALRYETALSIANGACCSIGDQLHPLGRMDPATYRLIGAAYQEVEAKEPWCHGVTPVADVALLSLEAIGAVPPGAHRTAPAEAGAARLLLEGKYLFNVVDAESDFSEYKVLVLPDRVTVDAALGAKVEHFLSGGGKVLASGKSGLDESGAFALDLGAQRTGANPYRPSYVRPAFDLKTLGRASFVMYGEGQAIACDGGLELAQREDAYFNRDAFSFCSHMHTPSRLVSAGPGIVESNNGIYIAWDVFEEYALHGSLPVKEIVHHTLDRLLGENKTLWTNLPAQGITTLMEQKSACRYVHHLLYASPVRRGERIEVIEDLLRLHDIEVRLHVPKKIQQVYLAPQMQDLPFEQEDILRYTLPRLECHQMVVLEYT